MLIILIVGYLYLVACLLECFIISPFLKIKTLGVSSGGILVTQSLKFPAPPKFEISYCRKICWKSTISLKRNEIGSSARHQNLWNGRLPISSQYIFSRLLQQKRSYLRKTVNFFRLRIVINCYVIKFRSV